MNFERSCPKSDGHVVRDVSELEKLSIAYRQMLKWGRQEIMKGSSEDGYSVGVKKLKLKRLEEILITFQILIEGLHAYESELCETQFNEISKRKKALHQVCSDLRNSKRECGDSLQRIPENDLPRIEKEKLDQTADKIEAATLYFQFEKRCEQAVNEILKSIREYRKQNFDDNNIDLECERFEILAKSMEEYRLAMEDLKSFGERIVTAWSYQENRVKSLLEIASEVFIRARAQYDQWEAKHHERLELVDWRVRVSKLSIVVSEYLNWLKEKETFPKGLNFEDFCSFENHVFEESNARMDAVVEQYNQISSNRYYQKELIANWLQAIIFSYQKTMTVIGRQKQKMELDNSVELFIRKCNQALVDIYDRLDDLSKIVNRRDQCPRQLKREFYEFENKLIGIEEFVSSIRGKAAELSNERIGGKVHRIQKIERDVMICWNHLQKIVAQEKTRVDVLVNEKEFFDVAEDWNLWCDETVDRIKASYESVENVSSLKLALNSHQSLREEINTKDETFSNCMKLGKDYLLKRFSLCSEINRECLNICKKRDRLEKLWRARWDEMRFESEACRLVANIECADGWSVESIPETDANLENTDQKEIGIDYQCIFNKCINLQERNFESLREETIADSIPPKEFSTGFENWIKRKCSVPVKMGVLNTKRFRQHKSLRNFITPWKKNFVVLMKGLVPRLEFHKDTAHYGEGKPPKAIFLPCKAEEEVKLSTKPNTIRVTMKDGKVFLFETESEQDSEDWITAINANFNGSIIEPHIHIPKIRFSQMEKWSVIERFREGESSIDSAN